MLTLQNDNTVNVQTFTDGTTNNITIIATGYTTDPKYFENWVIDGKLSKQDQKLLYLDFLVCAF
jgi:hypothetical protein